MKWRMYHQIVRLNQKINEKYIDVILTLFNNNNVF